MTGKGCKLTSNYSLRAARVNRYQPGLFATSKSHMAKRSIMSMNSNAHVCEKRCGQSCKTCTAVCNPEALNGYDCSCQSWL